MVILDDDVQNALYNVLQRRADIRSYQILIDTGIIWQLSHEIIATTKKLIAKQQCTLPEDSKLIQVKKD